MTKNKSIENKSAKSKTHDIDCSYCQMIFDKMLDGFALHDIICDRNGKACDYRFLQVNPSFEKMTGFKGKDIVGKTVLEVLPETEKSWISNYGEVVLTGKPIRFESYAKSLKKYFEVVAFSPQENQFATIFIDITARKEAENRINESLEKANKMLELMTERELKMIELKNENRDLKKRLEKLSK